MTLATDFEHRMGTRPHDGLEMTRDALLAMRERIDRGLTPVTASLYDLVIDVVAAADELARSVRIVSDRKERRKKRPVAVTS